MPRQWLTGDRDFLKLWTGQAISQIGSRITREGLPLTAVLVLGASPRQMGFLSGAGAAAILMFQGILPVGALTGGMLAESNGVRTTMWVGAAEFLLSRSEERRV